MVLSGTHAELQHQTLASKPCSPRYCVVLAEERVALPTRTSDDRVLFQLRRHPSNPEEGQLQTSPRPTTTTTTMMRKIMAQAQHLGSPVEGVLETMESLAARTKTGVEMLCLCSLSSPLPT